MENKRIKLNGDLHKILQSTLKDMLLKAIVATSNSKVEKIHILVNGFSGSFRVCFTVSDCGTRYQDCRQLLIMSEADELRVFNILYDFFGNAETHFMKDYAWNLTIPEVLNFIELTPLTI